MYLSRRSGLVCRALLHWHAVRRWPGHRDVWDDGLRQTVGSGPWTGVFDVIVAGHVLRNDRDLVARFRKQQGCGEAADSSAVMRSVVRHISLPEDVTAPKNDNVSAHCCYSTWSKPLNKRYGLDVSQSGVDASRYH